MARKGLWKQVDKENAVKAKDVWEGIENKMRAEESTNDEISFQKKNYYFLNEPLQNINKNKKILKKHYISCANMGHSN